jgi:hypothetical protein
MNYRPCEQIRRGAKNFTVYVKWATGDELFVTWSVRKTAGYV